MKTEDHKEGQEETQSGFAGSSALFKLLQLIIKHPNRNYDYYLITKTDAVHQAALNLDKLGTEAYTYSLT